MSRRLRHTFAFVCVLGLSGCALVPQDDQPQVRPADKPDGPMFDADYYAHQAKVYMEGRQYARAKQQWETLLKLQPTNYIANVAYANCDIFLADEAMSERRDLPAARALLIAADKRLRENWNGTVEADVTKADPLRPQWKSAMGVAYVARRLGRLDQVESARLAEVARRGGTDAVKGAKESADLAARSERHYADALGMFRKLADMKYAAPDAIKNLGELYLVLKQDAAAEREYNRFLGLARATRVEHEAQRKKVLAELPESEERKAFVHEIDETMRANADQQVAVLRDLAGLAWARRDYVEGKRLLDEALAVGPTHHDLLLKIAQVEMQLQMFESAKDHAHTFLTHASRTREDFDENIQRAMELEKTCDETLKSRKK